MIKHVVCFKLKDKKDIDKAVKTLLSMKGKVPTAIEIEVGKDFLGSARSFDIFLSVIVKDRTSLEEYQKDEYHVNVVKKFMHQVVEKSVAVDFEI